MGGGTHTLRDHARRHGGTLDTTAARTIHSGTHDAQRHARCTVARTMQSGTHDTQRHARCTAARTMHSGTHEGGTHTLRDHARRHGGTLDTTAARTNARRHKRCDSSFGFLSSGSWHASASARAYLPARPGSSFVFWERLSI